MEDAIKVFKTKTVKKTRRKHECWSCGTVVPKHHEMVNTTFSYDGRLVSVYKCSKCVQKSNQNEKSNKDQ